MEMFAPKTSMKAFNGTLPSEIKIFREEEREYITQKLNPISENRRMENLHIYGEEGSGKSFLLSSVGDKLLEKNSDLIINRIDCRVHDTEYKILRRLANCSGKTIPESGYSSTEVKEIFKEKLPADKEFVIILENVELLLEQEGDKLFYFLSRLDDENALPNVGIVSSSSGLTDLNKKLSPRVRSSYNFRKIELESLDPEKIVESLKKYFGEFGIRKEVIAKVINITGETYNTRTANLRLVFNVINELLGKFERPFTEKKIKSAYIRVQRQRYNFLKTMLSKHEELFLKAVRKVSRGNKTVWSGATYKAYKELCKENDIEPNSDRILGDYLTRLSLLGFVDVERYEGGSKGKTRCIKPRKIITQYDSNSSSKRDL